MKLINAAILGRGKTHPEFSVSTNIAELKFHDQVAIPFGNGDGKIWFTAEQLAELLGYANKDKVLNLYYRHHDEFTDSMTTITKVRVEGINSSLRELDIRLFSLRGAHLIGMLSRSKIAKELRIWLLELAEQETQPQVLELVNISFGPVKDLSIKQISDFFVKAEEYSKRENGTKGSTANAALWGDCFLNQKRCQYIAERRDRLYENFVGQPSGGSWGSSSTVILPIIGRVIFDTNHIKRAGCCSFVTSNAFCQVCTASPFYQADWQVCGIFETSQSAQADRQRELSVLVRYLLRKKYHESYWSVVQCGAGKEFPCLLHSSYKLTITPLIRQTEPHCNVQNRHYLLPIVLFSLRDSFPAKNDSYSREDVLFLARSLRSQASSTQAEKLDPVSSIFSCSTLASISSIRLCGNLIFFCADFALIDLVAILSPSVGSAGTPYIKDASKKRLTCGHTKNMVGVHLDCIKMENNNASECGNTAEASNHIVRWSNNMACSHDTQTRPKFVYLFLGTPNEFPDSTPIVLRTEADTEDDARAKFPRWALIFAAQIRTAAPCRLQIFSTDEGFMWIYEQRQTVPEEAHA